VGGATGVASSTAPGGAADASAPFAGSTIGLTGGTAPAAFAAASAIASAASAASAFAAALADAALAASSASLGEAVAGGEGLFPCGSVGCRFCGGIACCRLVGCLVPSRNASGFRQVGRILRDFCRRLGRRVGSGLRRRGRFGVVVCRLRRVGFVGNRLL